MHMLHRLLAWLRTIASDTRSAIVALVVSSLLGGGGLSVWLFPHRLLQILEQNIPLWLSLASSFGLLLVILLVLRQRERNLVRAQTPHTTEELMDIGQFKLRVTHSSGHVHSIEGLPYCKTHECKLVINGHEWHCPIPNCASVLHDSDLSRTRMYVGSVIERLIRNPPKS